MTPVPPALATAILLLAALLQQSHAPAPASTQFRITGTVVNALEGTPIPNAEVSIARMGSEDQEVGVIAGDDGRFAFLISSPGKYSLTARHSGFAKQAYLQHGNFASAIAVGANLDSENIVLRILPDASISGQVFDEQGDPVRGSQVMLFSQDTTSGKKEIAQSSQASADDEGRYHFAHLSLGIFYLAIAAHPWYAQNIQRYPSGTNGGPRGSVNNDEGASLDVTYPITFYPDATDSSEAEAIALKPSDKFQADIHLSPVPATHVLVTFPRGGSSPNHESFLGGASRTVFGTSKITVPTTAYSSSPGIVEIAGLAPAPYELQYLVRAGKRMTAKSEEVNIADGAELNLNVDPTGSRVGGVVRVESGAEMPGSISVMIRNVDSNEIRGTQVTPDGKFNFEHDAFAAGRYQLMSISDQSLVLRTVSATGARVSGEYLDVDSTNDVHLTIVMAHYVPTVDGVALQDGKPVAGVMIVLVPQNPADHQSMFCRDETNSDGSFSLAAVVPGKYTAIAIDDGWNIEWANPSVLAKYLPGGTTVDVETEGKYNLHVKVQQP
jgi:5-hydroxyisourate hydrolase-like protein (transthyretin family)